MDDDEKMREELKILQIQINKTTDESLESTRNMVRDATEAEDAGIKTTENLNKQGEQLKNINKGMDNINENMKQVERDLEDMEKCCGICVCPWNRARRPKEASQFNSKKQTVISQPERVKRKRKTNATKAQYIQSITNDEREVEMNDNIRKVEGIVVNLKGMAEDMGKELNEQNVELDNINTKADSNKAKVDSANVRAGKLLKS